MDIKQLKQVLREKGLPSDLVNFSKEYPFDAFCIRQIENGSWEVYYTERGSKFDYKKFSSEKAACLYLLRELLNLGVDDK